MSTAKAGEMQPELRKFMANSVIVRSDKWWRTESPPAERTVQNVNKPFRRRDAADYTEKDANQYQFTQMDVDYAEPPRAGVFSYHRWPQYFTTSQVGYGPMNADPQRHEKRSEMGVIPGYSGHIPGKIAGGCVGGTFAQATRDAVEHLDRTKQSQRFPPETRTKFMTTNEFRTGKQ